MKKLASLILVFCLFLYMPCTTVSAQSIVDSEMMEVQRLVNTIKSNELILQAVDEGTSDADEWWEWYNDLPLTHEKYVSKKSVGQWLQWYITIPTEERIYLNYNPLLFSEKQDDVLLSISSFLPLGGYEHDYNPQYWEPLKKKANCYAYSLNTYGGDGYSPYPGEASGWNDYSLSYLRSHTPQLLAADGPYYNGKTISYTTENSVPGRRQYKIACVFSNDEYGNIEGGDYHFYRQDSNGYWSHKRGELSVTQTDSNGYAIENPKTCGRNYGYKWNYSVWGGYYMVTY